MDHLLFALAIFNFISTIMVFAPRAIPHTLIPILTFLFALPATELAWLWLPLQMSIASGLALGGALESTLGQVAIVILLVTWPSLLCNIIYSFRTEKEVKKVLRQELGDDYLESLPDSRREKINARVNASDWLRPLKMSQDDVEVIKHVSYGEHGDRNTLDIYRPRDIPEQGCPVVLQLPGGGWVTGTKDVQALPLMYQMAQKGWICVAANYRLSPKFSFPAHLEDCKAALAWIRTNGHEYGMDSRFVAVTGGSAGGHLTALMGLTPNRPELQPGFEDVDTSVQACVPLYGVYDFKPGAGHLISSEAGTKFLEKHVMHVSREESPELWSLASPVDQVHPLAPPFMIVHGSFDSLVPVGEGRDLNRELRRVSKSPVLYLELEGAEHAFEMVHSPRTEYTINGIHCFLEWTLARFNECESELEL